MGGGVDKELKKGSCNYLSFIKCSGAGVKNDTQTMVLKTLTCLPEGAEAGEGVEEGLKKWSWYHLTFNKCS